VEELRDPIHAGDHRLPMLVEAFPEAALLGIDLVEAGLTIAVGESCTGGLLGAALTAVAGSSAYVRGGVIAYADDVKAEHLGVGRHLLATHGAVSPEVAEAMATGARMRYEADLGVGITGVAGPDASEHKPAGLVFVAVAGPASIRGIRLDTDAGRELNRAHAVEAALRLCRDVVRGMRDAEPGSTGAS
jgi:nicotinamide-nucleotide amidase